MSESLILAIESSCDETSVSVVRDGVEILSNIVASQVKSHMRFGGVVPEVASRHHVEQITHVIDLALEESQTRLQDVDAVAVTQGPGLVGALLVGVTAAKALAMVSGRPLIGVNHLAGHIYASQLVEPLTYPALALIVSGGHTELVYVSEPNHFEIIGETQDDAVGEAYDKVGRMLDLPYPAGKYMDELAAKGNQAAYAVPRAMLHEDNLDFSFSGMKSAVMNLVHNARQRGETIVAEDLAASFQAAAVEVLVAKTLRALDAHPEVRQFILAGGVAANTGLRSALTQQLSENYPQVAVVIPPLKLCGDNAAMIGASAHHLYQAGAISPLDMNALPGLSL